MNSDPPIDDAAMDRSIKERRDRPEESPPGPQGFAVPDLLEERRSTLFAQLNEICLGEDGNRTAREIVQAIELLARRIAIDMLASDEMVERLYDFGTALSNGMLESTEFKSAVAEKFDEMFEYAFNRRSITLLESNKLEEKIRAIVDERMTSNLKGIIRLRGQTPPDGKRQPPDCDHQWIANEGEETGSTCRLCGIIDAIKQPTDPK